MPVARIECVIARFPAPTGSAGRSRQPPQMADRRPGVRIRSWTRRVKQSKERIYPSPRPHKVRTDRS